MEMNSGASQDPTFAGADMFHNQVTSNHHLDLAPAAPVVDPEAFAFADADMVHNVDLKQLPSEQDPVQLTSSHHSDLAPAAPVVDPSLLTPTSPTRVHRLAPGPETPEKEPGSSTSHSSPT